MRKSVAAVWTSVLALAILAGCSGPGMITEKYVNQANKAQTLELTTKETVKGMLGGRIVNPAGQYTLQSEDKVTGGKFTRVETAAPPQGAEPRAYVMKLEGNKELKLWILAGNSGLRDDSGNTWKLEGRYHEWRSQPKEVALHLRARK